MMKNRNVKILFTITLSFILILANEIAANPFRDANILNSSNQGLTFEFVPQDWRSSEMIINGQLHQSFTFRGADYLGTVGEPEIPVRVVTLGVPLDADVRVQVIDSQFDRISNTRLLPVPMIHKDSLATYYEYHPAEDIYSASAPFPHNIIELEGPHLFRLQRTVRILLKPLQYLPQQRVVRKYRSITIRVEFSGSQSGQQVVVKPAGDEQWYKNLLLNYQQARKWRQPGRKKLQKGAVTFEGENWYKITLRSNSDGFFKMTGKWLADKGVPIASIDSAQSIQIFGNGGRELPEEATDSRPDSLIENAIIVVGEEDGRFDPDDYILFFGKSIQGWAFNEATGEYEHYINHYGFENVYYLTFGKSKGKRIAERQSQASAGLTPETSFRDRAFLEEEIDNIWHSGRDWFGKEFTRTEGSQEATFNFSMPGAEPADSTFFDFRFVGASIGEHRLYMFANGNVLGSVAGAGYMGIYVFITTQVRTAGVLLDGNNAITVRYTGSSDMSRAYLDWLEIEYGRRFEAVGEQLLFNAPIRNGSAAYRISGFSRDDIEIYDVTDFYNVKRITDIEINKGVASFADECDPTRAKRYLAITPAAYGSVSNIVAHRPHNLRIPRVVDYIIITHNDFLQQAEQLASLRENRSDPEERLATEVVPISAIYDEFSWGLVDATAVRDFLKYAQENWGSPQYVMLFGDGHYDYKNILHYDKGNWILPYENLSRSETSTRTTDDWFVYTRGISAGVQMAIGRIPVNTPAEAQQIADKIIAYETQPTPGDWRNIFTMVADDEASPKANNETIHTYDAERIIEDHVPDSFERCKIYLMEFPPVRSASISWVMKPAANEMLIQQLNRGTLIVNFIGHGAAQLWTHERVLNKPHDFNRIQNESKMAFWIAASCDFAHWDSPIEQSLPEDLLVVPGRGSIGTFASARLAFAGSNAALNSNFLNYLYTNYSSTGKLARLGDALFLAKCSGGNRENNEKYIILGDPTLRLAAPQYKAFIEQTIPDTIQALRQMTVRGRIEKYGQLWSDYAGRVLVKAFDSKRPRTYVTEHGSEVNYILPGNPVFRGVIPVRNGRFEATFIVPKDITYGGTEGRISAYFWGDQGDGAGYQDHLPVGGTATDLVDHEGPIIKIRFGDKEFIEGDYVTQNPVLTVDITDSLSGVNIAGDIGHKITMFLDGNEEDKKDVTESFQYREGSYLSGVLRYQLYDLEEGAHTVAIKAWDNSNNASTAETEFTVVADTVLQIRNVLTYPNPMKRETNFTFELSQDAEVTIKLYSVAGRLLRSFDTFYATIGFNTLPEPWNGTDQDGDPLSNGVYLYKVIAKVRNGGQELKADKIGKLVIAR